MVAASPDRAAAPDRAASPGWLDFRHQIVRPVLDYLLLASPAAENLLVGTAAVESGLRRLTQAGGGPGVGVYQIEPATHADVWNNYLHFRPELAARVRGLMASKNWCDGGRDKELYGNLFYATAIARVIYLRAPRRLPEAHDLVGLAAYWKAYYNTPQGRGTPTAFLAAYPGGE